MTGGKSIGRRWILPMSVASVVVLADQLAKATVRRHVPLYDTVSVIPGVFDLTHVRNTGAAFGLFNAVDFPFKSVVMMVVAFGALIAIAAYAVRLGTHERLARVGLALILGGALGNLIDRAVHGYVLDFVDVYWRGVHFWAFNVADASITVGAVLVIFEVLFGGKPHDAPTAV
ncbi:MAG TPA: signal peptidase II [Gemmatimonadaceae bacterium]|nr:signal peptidase II [Gemmatimonadaceae bacterium]